MENTMAKSVNDIFSLINNDFLDVKDSIKILQKINDKHTEKNWNLEYISLLASISEKTQCYRYLHELSGVKPVITLGRSYPFSNSYTHVLGYVSQVSQNDLVNSKIIKDRNVPGLRVGKSGLEKTFEGDLIGSKQIGRGGEAIVW